MGDSNFHIKYNDPFKLYVLLKDKIIFESELEKNDIDFYVDNEQGIIGSETRYYFADKDRLLVDEILKRNEIIADTETIRIGDYRDEQKVMKTYLMVVILVIFVMGTIMLLMG